MRPLGSFHPSARAGLVFPLVLMGIFSLGFLIIFVHSMSRGYSSQVTHVEEHLRVQAIGQSVFSQVLAKIRNKPFRDRFFFPRPFRTSDEELLGGTYDLYVVDAPNKPFQVDIYVQARFFDARKLFFWRVQVDHSILDAAGKAFPILFTTLPDGSFPTSGSGSPMAGFIEDILSQRKANKTAAENRFITLVTSNSLKDDLRILDGPPTTDVEDVVDTAPPPPPPPPPAQIPTPPPPPLTQTFVEDFNGTPNGGYPSGWQNMFVGVSAKIAEPAPGRKVFDLVGRSGVSQTEYIPVTPGDQFAYECEIEFPKGNHGGAVGFMISRPGGCLGTSHSFVFTNLGIIKFKNGNSPIEIGTWKEGTVYTVRLEMDFTDNTGRILVNGEVLREKVPIASRSYFSSEYSQNVSLDKFGAATANTNDGQVGEMYVQSVKFYQ